MGPLEEISYRFPLDGVSHRVKERVAGGMTDAQTHHMTLRWYLISPPAHGSFLFICYSVTPEKLKQTSKEEEMYPSLSP